MDIFDAIPGQLTKAEKRLKLSSIDKAARQREYSDAFMWLVDAMIVNHCFNSTDPNAGLALLAYQDSPCGRELARLSVNPTFSSKSLPFHLHLASCLCVTILTYTAVMLYSDMRLRRSGYYEKV